MHATDCKGIIVSQRNDILWKLPIVMKLFALPQCTSNKDHGKIFVYHSIAKYPKREICWNTFVVEKATPSDLTTLVHCINQKELCKMRANVMIHWVDTLSPNRSLCPTYPGIRIGQNSLIRTINTNCPERSKYGKHDKKPHWMSKALQ